MPNPGGFPPAQKAFLTGLRPQYTAAAENNTVQDILKIIHRRFGLYFPLDKGLDYNPTPEELALVDEDSPAPEYPFPDASAMSASQFVEAIKKWNERQDLVRRRKEKIDRWFSYRHDRDHKAPKDNTNIILGAILAKVETPAPRLLPASSIWRRPHRADIEADAKSRCLAEGKSLHEGLAPIREDIVRTRFKALPAAEREQYGQMAQAEHKKAMETWKAKKGAEPSTLPDDRQRCIQTLADTVQPLLDAICLATGWKATLIAGGPLPAAGGRISVLSIHSGATTGDVPMDFGLSEFNQFHKVIVPVYSKFMRKCFDPDVCRSQTLKDASGEEEEWLKRLRGDESSYTRLDILDMGNSKTDSTQPGSSSPPPVEQSAKSSPLFPFSPQRPHSREGSRSLSPLDLSVPPPIASPLPCPSLDLAGDPVGLSAPLFSTVTASESSAPSPPCVPPSGPCPSPPPPPPPSPPPPPPPTQVSSPTPLPSQSPPPASARSSPRKTSKRRHPDSDTNEPPTKPSQSAPPPPARSSPRKTSKKRHTDSDANERPTKKVKVTKVSKVSNPPPPASPVMTKTTRSSKAREHLIPSPSIPVPTMTTSPARPEPTTTSTPIAVRKGRATKASRSAIPAKHEGTDEWFQSAMVLFTNGAQGLGENTTETLGEEWVNLVGAWSAFQRKAGFDVVVNTKLPTKGRPSVVGSWIARARSASWRPTVDDVKGYQQNFERWWTIMQPSWRVADGRVIETAVTGDWSPLWVPGQNGLLSVVAALFYWGLAIHGKPPLRKKWLHALKDCTLAFNQLANIEAHEQM